jgi:asparagine synthase (glutamine-hydrolysing)
MLWIERLKRMAGPLDGAMTGILALLNKVVRSPRLDKFLPMMSTPFDSYYYSRTSTPFRFFNAHYKEIYSSDFAQSVEKQHSLLPVTQLLQHSEGQDLVSRMLYVDTKTWLPDDLLVKADKMTMANSVELRVPLLDHEVLEFAASLPSDFKVHGFQTKYIAKKSLSRVVPQAILDRKKAGFPVPYESWIRSELKDWVQDVLLDSESLSRGYFKKEAVELLLKNNLESGNYPKEVFSLAVLELWHREFLNAAPVSSPASLHPVPVS